MNGNDWPRLVLTTGCVGLVIAWSTNLYNFMDGTDGLAGTMGVVGFAAYGFAALAADPARIEGIVSAPAFLALAAAILPFLAVNKPRATLFLGDVGAVPLGFLAAAFGAAGVVYGMWPAWFPVLVFLPFIADATLTLLRRIATPRAPVGRSPLALLSAPCTAWRRTRRHACGLCSADGRHGGDGARMPHPGAAVRLVGTRCLGSGRTHVVRHN